VRFRALSPTVFSVLACRLRQSPAPTPNFGSACIPNQQQCDYGSGSRSGVRSDPLEERVDG